MNLKKVLWATAILGLLICGFVAYQIYSAIFSPNTQFNNDEAFVYIESDASFADVKKSLEPLLEDLSTFEAVSKRKGYITNIKAGKYALKKGMNNNEIINTLRSANIPVKVSFNNQESLTLLAGRISEQIEADSLSLLQTFNDPVFWKRPSLTNTPNWPCTFQTPMSSSGTPMRKVLGIGCEKNTSVFGTMNVCRKPKT